MIRPSKSPARSSLLGHAVTRCIAPFHGSLLSMNLVVDVCRCWVKNLWPTILLWYPFGDRRQIASEPPISPANEFVVVILLQPVANWSAILEKYLPTSNTLREQLLKVVIRGLVSERLSMQFSDKELPTGMRTFATTSGNHHPKRWLLLVSGRRMVVTTVWP